MFLVKVAHSTCVYESALHEISDAPTYRTRCNRTRMPASISAQLSSKGHLRQQVEHVALLLPDKECLGDRQRLHIMIAHCISIRL